MTADGARIAYQLFGQGATTLVASAGSFSHTDVVWEDPAAALFYARLSSFARILRYDRLGTSNSDPFPSHWDTTWEGYARELEAVLRVVDAPAVALLAMLDAGPMAIRFAALHPEQVERLILFNTTARFLAGDDYPIGLAPDDYGKMVEAVRETWGTEAQLALNVPSRLGDEAFTRWYGKYTRAIGTPNTVADAMVRMANLDARECLPDLRTPTLVMHRAEYRVIPPSHGRYLADHIPHAAFIEIPGTDGPMFWETPDLILSQIRDFLSGEPSAEPPAAQVTTVLFTDIVGSTDRLRQLGDREWTALLGVHAEITTQTVAAFGGWLVKSTGDGILATFPGPESALECAHRIRHLLTDMGIAIRAGLHTGRVETAQGDVGGLAVNIAARVMANAPDGEIVVSRTIRDLLLGSRYKLGYLGTRQLKGVDGEWDLYRLV